MSHIIEEIIALEWDLIKRAELGREQTLDRCGREFFASNRKSRLTAWSETLRESYYQDLYAAQKAGRNPMDERYCYMLEQTDPEAFMRIKGQLPERSMEQLYLMDWISEHLVEWQEGLAQKYPHLVGRQDLIRRNPENGHEKTFEAHIRCELATFSEQTLRTYAAYIELLQKNGKNLNQMIFENVIEPYGCQTLEEAERFLAGHRQCPQWRL